MSRNWIAPKCKYSVQGRCISTDGKYHEKISGTTLGAMLGVSPYATPFTVTTKLMGVWNEDISDKPAIRVGVALEERIIDYQASKHPSLGNFLKASEVFEERTGDHAVWSSDFEDDVFAGHVDGIISKDGKDYILEVKTANKASVQRNGTWKDSPPEHYLWQVYLYNHFITKQDKAYFLLGLVDENTYADPYSWVPNKENCFLYEVSINQEMVAAKLEAIRQIYNETVMRGISAECTDCEMDKEIMMHLMDISESNDHLAKLTEEYIDLKIANKFYLDKNKANIEKEEELKERIKDIMIYWNLTENESVKIQSSVRKSFDFAKAKKDNLDVSAYTKETIIKSLKTKE